MTSVFWEIKKILKLVRFANSAAAVWIFLVSSILTYSGNSSRCRFMSGKVIILRRSLPGHLVCNIHIMPKPRTSTYNVVYRKVTKWTLCSILNLPSNFFEKLRQTNFRRRGRKSFLTIILLHLKLNRRQSFKGCGQWVGAAANYDTSSSLSRSLVVVV